MTLSTWILVAVAGAIGAPVRYLLDGFVQDRVRGDVPWGTFTVNMTGSFALGFLTGLSANGHLGRFGLSVLGTGFCGAFTTFSTFTFEVVRLIETGEHRTASIAVGASVVIGLAAAGTGLALAGLIPS